MAENMSAIRQTENKASKHVNRTGYGVYRGERPSPKLNALLGQKI